MIVIIDGYNLLKRSSQVQGAAFAFIRRTFIFELNRYGNLKHGVIKRLLVVFDGGPGDYVQEETFFGVQVVYAGAGKSADDWIIDFVAKNRGPQVVLISTDRALCKRCQSYQVTCMDAEEFQRLYKTALRENQEPKTEPVGSSTMVKYEHQEDDFLAGVVPDDLDQLMEEASRHVRDKGGFSDYGKPHQAGPKVTCKKKEKAGIMLRKKLG